MAFGGSGFVPLRSTTSDTSNLPFMKNFSGKVDMPGAQKAANPLDEFINQYNKSWEMQGGSPGYDMSPAIKAQYQALRDKSATRKGEAETGLTNLYNKLQESYKGLPEQTNQRYAAAIQGSQAGSDKLVQDTRARIDSEAAARAAAFAELGIGGGGQLSAQQAEMERGIGDVNAATANWGGLLGAQQQAQVTRDNLNYTGAADAGTLAKEDLLRRYNAYLDSLDVQEQQALSQPGVRSAGSAGKMVNTSGIADSLYNKAVEQQMIQAGVLPSSSSTFDEWKRRYDYQLQHPKQTGTGFSGGSNWSPAG